MLTGVMRDHVFISFFSVIVMRQLISWSVEKTLNHYNKKKKYIAFLLKELKRFLTHSEFVQSGLHNKEISEMPNPTIREIHNVSVRNVNF